MTLLHQNATATITIDGLAICCFNHIEHVWDLAFLHKDDDDAEPRCEHTLTLQVDGTTISLPDNPQQIAFETINAQVPDYSGSFADGFFDAGPIHDRSEAPTTADELENFRWVLDLEDPAEVAGVRSLKTPTTRPTRVLISNAVFYTNKITSNTLFFFPYPVDPNGLSTGQINRGLLGRTNDRIAADIFCQSDGAVVIKVDGVEQPPLNHRPGKPWQIVLTNLCDREPSGGYRFEKGDFHLFYDALDFVPPKLVIWGEPVKQAPTSAQIDRVSGRTDCDTTRVGTSGNLDVLFDSTQD